MTHPVQSCISAGSSRRGTAQPPRISPTLGSLFARYSRYYVRRHFTALHLSGELPIFERKFSPYVIYLNHASWWDPLICLLLAREFAWDQAHYAPMDEKMLAKFSFFRKLGFFGIAKDTRRGASQFVQMSRALLSEPGTALWITPQGDFVDQRYRPTELKNGLSILPEICGNVSFVPLAIDYSFAAERLPYAGARFGEQITASEFPYRTRAEWSAQLSVALEQTQDLLAEDVISRRVLRNEPIVCGRRGTGGIYGWWQKLRGKRC